MFNVPILYPLQYGGQFFGSRIEVISQSVDACVCINWLKLMFPGPKPNTSWELYDMKSVKNCMAPDEMASQVHTVGSPRALAAY